MNLQDLDSTCSVKVNTSPVYREQNIQSFSTGAIWAGGTMIIRGSCVYSYM